MGALFHADCTVLVVFSARLHVTEFIKKLPQHKTYVSLCVFHAPVFERGGDFYSNIQFCRAKGMCLELNYASPLPYKDSKAIMLWGLMVSIACKSTSVTFTFFSADSGRGRCHSSGQKMTQKFTTGRSQIKIKTRK